MGFRWCERGILDYSGQFIVLIRTGWLAFLNAAEQTGTVLEIYDLFVKFGFYNFESDVVIYTRC